MTLKLCPSFILMRYSFILTIPGLSFPTIYLLCFCKAWFWSDWAYFGWALEINNGLSSSLGWAFGSWTFAYVFAGWLHIEGIPSFLKNPALEGSTIFIYSAGFDTTGASFLGCSVCLKTEKKASDLGSSFLAASGLNSEEEIEGFSYFFFPNIFWEKGEEEALKLPAPPPKIFPFSWGFSYFLTSGAIGFWGIVLSASMLATVLPAVPPEGLLNRFGEGLLLVEKRPLKGLGFVYSFGALTKAGVTFSATGLFKNKLLGYFFSSMGFYILFSTFFGFSSFLTSFFSIFLSDSFLLGIMMCGDFLIFSIYLMISLSSSLSMA